MGGFSWYHEMERASPTVYIAWYHRDGHVQRLGQGRGPCPDPQSQAVSFHRMNKWSWWRIVSTPGLCSTTHYERDSQDPIIPCPTSPKLASITHAGLFPNPSWRHSALQTYTARLRGGSSGVWMCRLGCPTFMLPGPLGKLQLEAERNSPRGLQGEQADLVLLLSLSSTCLTIQSWT